MGPVSGQVQSWIGEALHRWSATRPGLAGICRELDERGTEPLPWVEFVALCSRIEALLGGDESLVRAVRDFTAAKLEAGSPDRVGFSDERQAYWFVVKALAPALLPNVRWSFESLDEARIQISASIPDEMPMCPGLCALIEGALAAVPRAAGRGFARVRCLCSGRDAAFEVETARPDTAPLDTRRLAMLAGQSDSVFMEADDDGTILFVSPNAQEIFGAAPESLVGRTFAEVAEPRSYELVRTLGRRLQGSDEPTQIEFRFEHSDGTLHLASFVSHVFLTETGERHFVAVMRDITEHADAERLRQERVDLLERVAKATPDAMMVVDVEAGKITSLTDGGFSWMGAPKDAVEDRSPAQFHKLIHPDDLPKLAAHRQRAFALGPGEVCQAEVRARQPDGSWRWLRLRDVVFSRKEDGAPKEILICVGDVTEQVETTHALAESQDRYRRVTEAAADYSFCVRVDPDGTIEREWLTESFYRMTGYNEAEYPLERWEANVHPDDHAACRRSFVEGLAQGAGAFEFRLLTATGETRWIDEHFEVQREDSGVVRIYGACRDITEQRLAEQARKAVEERYRAITENSWDIIGELGPDGRATFISPNIRDVLGWEPRELIDSLNPDLIHPDDSGRISEQIAKILAGADEGLIELRVRHKQGGWRRVELTATVFRGNDGQRRGVFLGRDVTERLRMEEEHERLGSVVSASSELIAIFEPDGRLVFLNRAGRRMTGLGSQPIGGSNLFDLLDLSEATRLRQEALEIALHERAWEGECQIQPVGDEGAFPVLANVFRLPDPRTGEGHKLAMVARDIRARKRAENALQESEQRFRMLVENAFDMIAEIDEAGNFIYASPRYRDLLGYDPDSMVGDSIFEALHPDDGERVASLMETFVERPSTDLGPLRVRAKDGTWHWLENQVRHYRRRSGETILVVVSRDITGRRLTEQALQHSQEQLLQSQKMEAIGRLAGGVAHDFNNLLTAITGYSDLIYQELGEGDPLRDDAAEILHASEQASGLTRQLLAFSRRQVMQPRVVELNALVSDVDRLLRRLIGERVELATSLAPDVGPVRVDPGQVEQLLVNLAINARDAMAGGGRLEIVTGALALHDGDSGHPGIPAGSWVTLAVSDTGEGMSEDTIAHIFEPFFTTKDSDKGTGLGLSTVYGIVQQSRGHIRVESEASRGTTFTVYLPRSEAALDPAKPVPVRADLRGSETVVLVEADESVRRLLTRYMEEHGYRVIAAGCPVDALRAVRRHEAPIDLLITDVVLPKMDCHALTERLRQDHPNLRVLFVSGFSDDDLTLPAFEQGEHALIQKPFLPPELLLRMRALLGPG